VINVAKRLVPQIEAAPGAPEGCAEVVSEKFFTENVTNQDMILCRLTAPLVAMAFWLIRGGKRAKVKGRDIGAALRKVIDEVESLKNSSWETFDTFLEQWRANQLRVAQNRADAEMLTISINDKADSVLAVWDGALRAGAVSIAELRAHLEDLFSDDERGVILLSTIHRAKGLEAETVYLLAPEKLPHPMAKSPDAVQQESNLAYVAITRAMRRFYVVETPGRPLTSFWNALLNPQKELDLEVTK
jgi:DNA helicase-2/ATP-dependent DNA helicase PcrA